jgi:hypothetical protein
MPFFCERLDGFLRSDGGGDVQVTEAVDHRICEETSDCGRADAASSASDEARVWRAEREAEARAAVGP